MRNKELTRRLKHLDPVDSEQQFSIDNDQKAKQILQRVLRDANDDSGTDFFSYSQPESRRITKRTFRLGFAPSAAVLALAIVIAGVIFKFSSSYETDRSATAGGPKDELVNKIKGQLQGAISKPGIWHYKYEAVNGMFLEDRSTEEGWFTANGHRTRVLRYDSQGKLALETVFSGRVVTRYSGDSGKVTKKRVPKDTKGLLHDVNPLKEVVQTLRSGEVASIRSETVNGQQVYVLVAEPWGFRLTYTLSKETLYPVQYKYGDEKAYLAMDFKTFEILPETSENRKLLKFKGPAGK